MAELKDKVAVILGASSIGGLGDAIARMYVSEGAKVMLSGRKVDPLKNLSDVLGGAYETCDITIEDDIENLFNATKKKFVSIDLPAPRGIQ